MSKLPLKLSKWLSLLAILGLLAVIGVGTLQKTYWVGSTNLEVEFAIIDADTGEPIPHANVDVFSDGAPVRYSDNGDQQFRMVADQQGRIKRRFENCMTAGKESAFENTWSVDIPSWYLWVSAQGYQKVEQLELDTFANSRRVQGRNPVATLFIEILLKKIPDVPKDSLERPRGR